jgi:hypothetical protein
VIFLGKTILMNCEKLTKRQHNTRDVVLDQVMTSVVDTDSDPYVFGLPGSFFVPNPDLDPDPSIIKQK